MVMMTRRTLALSSLAVLAGCATKAPTQAPPAPTPPAIGTFGIDLSARDLTVQPGADFFKYCNGTWLASNEIPADRTRWGAFDMLAAKAEQDVKAIVEEVAASGGAAGTNAQKIADYYNAFLNQDEITAKGLAAASQELQQIEAIRTHADVVAFVSRPDIPTNFPIAWGIGLDDKDPDKYAVFITHSGLGLPDREYYRRNDEQFVTIRREYEAHIARMLTIAGQSGATTKARAIVRLETAIAERHWPIEQRREANLIYNKKTRAELIAIDPRFPWEEGLRVSELGEVQTFVVQELSAMAPLAQLVRRTPINTWKAYLAYHFLHLNAALLPKAVDDENFAFYGRTLNGQPQQRDRWKRGVQALNGALGEAVGEIYVQRHFPPASKAQMQELVENLRRAYGARIDAIAWMSPETKVVAHQKLATFRPKIGYPDRWRDYSALEIKAGEAFGNSKRAAEFDWRRQVVRINAKTDREEWAMTPPTVNAYYNATFNEIVFPAAILQPPFFDPNADAAVNYGAIGGVIGHEMGHGFDDQGAKYDAQGVLRDWWNAEDVSRFSALGDKLAEQYSAFEPLPDVKVNGRLTLGENIGDNGGLQVAHEAYKLSLGGATPPELEGTTGEQRFFLSWGQVWRENIRDQRLRNQVLSDPHSPARYRVNGVVRNLDAWYAAFNVQPGEALFLPPDQRVQIW
ncbi:MAG: M13 family metallopeptidase [Hyphomonadaceae bacterium]|nr:M13 family metallopeptidase [Hyphomonadaceae bacterium]